MLILDCPWCGPRNVSEFHHVDELVERPDPTVASPERWRAHLYLRANPAGPVRELWFHRAGCRQSLIAERDTVTNTVRATRSARPDGREASP